MGVGAGLYLYVVVVQKFTFAMSSPDKFLFYHTVKYNRHETDDCASRICAPFSVAFSDPFYDFTNRISKAENS